MERWNALSSSFDGQDNVTQSDTVMHEHDHPKHFEEAFAQDDAQPADDTSDPYSQTPWQAPSAAALAAQEDRSNMRTNDVPRPLGEMQDSSVHTHNGADRQGGYSFGSAGAPAMPYSIDSIAASRPYQAAPAVPYSFDSQERVQGSGGSYLGMGQHSLLNPGTGQAHPYGSGPDATPIRHSSLQDTSPGTYAQGGSSATTAQHLVFSNINLAPIDQLLQSSAPDAPEAPVHATHSPLPSGGVQSLHETHPVATAPRHSTTPTLQPAKQPFQQLVKKKAKTKKARRAQKQQRTIRGKVGATPNPQRFAPQAAGPFTATPPAPGNMLEVSNKVIMARTNDASDSYGSQLSDRPAVNVQLPLGIDISMVELMTFAPRCLEIPDVIARAVGAGYKREDLAKMVLHPVGLLTSKAEMEKAINRVQKQITYGGKLYDGNRPTDGNTFSCKDFRGRHGQQDDLTTDGWELRCDYGHGGEMRFGHMLLSDLYRGVVTWPMGADRLLLTECLHYARAHPNLALDTSHFDWILQQIQSPTARSGRDAAFDRDTLRRFREAVQDPRT